MYEPLYLLKDRGIYIVSHILINMDMDIEIYFQFQLR